MSRKQRVLQFYHALTGRLTAEELHEVEAMLPAEAFSFFQAMHRTDQYHAYHVAMTVRELARGCQADVDESFLLRCALLHDIGRRKGDLDIVGKVVCVLMNSFFPSLSAQIAEKKVESPFKALDHALYVYHHHPQIGADMLAGIGMDEEAAIILHHHERSKAGDPAVLSLLRLADERN